MNDFHDDPSDSHSQIVLGDVDRLPEGGLDDDLVAEPTLVTKNAIATIDLFGALTHQTYLQFASEMLSAQADRAVWIVIRLATNCGTALSLDRALVAIQDAQASGFSVTAHVIEAVGPGAAIVACCDSVHLPVGPANVAVGGATLSNGEPWGELPFRPVVALVANIASQKRGEGRRGRVSAWKTARRLVQSRQLTKQESRRAIQYLGATNIFGATQ